MDEPVTSEETDDIDDPVVEEISIINSKRLEDSLYLFQYPLLSKNSTNEHKIKKCFYKPQNQEAQLELAMNVNSSKFDVDRAEIIAQEVDGDLDKLKDDKKPFFENGMVDKIFLKSTTPISDTSNYAVATYNGSEIHLTALKNIFQFRPSFPYMEKGLKRKKNSELEDDEEEAGSSSAQQVTVKFKQSNDRFDKAKDTFKSLQAKSAEEPWSECSWCEFDSTESSLERLKLIADYTHDVCEGNELSGPEYLKLLIPPPQELAPLEPCLPSHVLSLQAIRGLPILEQCRLLLKNAQIIQFQQLLMLLAGGEGLTSEALLRTLPKVAVLVRGNWIVKSEVLYPPNTFSATSGVPAELMCRARDYVLYLFTKNQYVERKKISSVMSVPSEEIKEIFTGISSLSSRNKGWELHLPADLDFLNKHIDLVQKQNLFWEHRFHQLSELLKDSKTRRRKSRSESKSISEDGRPRNGVIYSSDNDSGTEKNKSPVAARKNKTVKVANIPVDVTS